MKTRTHKFEMTVTFNKPCTAKVALREMRDDGDINADTHYCTQYDQAEPETFRVRSIKRAKPARAP